MKTIVWAHAPASVFVSLAFLSLAACDGAPSAIPARSHAAGDTADRRLADSIPEASGGGGEYRTRTSYTSDGGQRAARTEDTPLFHGKPIWAANKNHSGQENADYHFKRDGDVFEAKTEDEFLTKVHVFIDTPPSGVQTVTRGNGDKLMYDPKGNIFAVADKQGAPRTLFKPKDGQAYWDKQKEAVASGEDSFKGAARRTSRKGADDNG